MSGEVVVVTGAGRGIGRGVAETCADAGMRVVVNDVGVELDGTGQDASLADTVVAGIRARGGEAIATTHTVATLDGASATIDAAVATFGRVDVLVANAGVMRDVPFLEMREEDWTTVVDVNLTGVFAACRAAAPRMAAQGGGRILAMSSINAYGTSSMNDVVPTRANYSASKAGVLGLVWALAGELASRHITCNAVMPTASTRLMTAAQERRRAMGLPVAERALVQRDPRTVARLVLGLLAPTAAALTGQVFQVDRDLVTHHRFPPMASQLEVPPHWDADDLGRELTRLAG